MISIIVMYAILAATFIFAKQTLNYAPPFFILGLRMTLGGGVLLAYAWCTQAKKICREDIGLFIATMFFHIYLTYTLEFWALQYVSALKTTIIFSATPFITALLNYFIHQEGLTPKKLCGILIGLVGLLPMFIEQASTVGSSYDLLQVSLPEVVLLVAVTSAAYAWFIIKKLMIKGYATSTINGFAMFVGGLASFLTAGLTENLSNPISNVLPFVGWLGLLILSSNIIMYNMYAWLLQRYSIVFVSLTGFLCPSFAALFDWFFITGTYSITAFVATIFIGFGLMIFYSDDQKPKLNDYQQ